MNFLLFLSNMFGISIYFVYTPISFWCSNDRELITLIKDVIFFLRVFAKIT